MEEKFIQCHHSRSLDYSVACNLQSCMQFQVWQINWSHSFRFLTDVEDHYNCFTKIWNVKIFFAKLWAGYQITLLFKFTMFLQCQISLPFSIYKVFTEPNQCLDLHDVYDDKYLLDTAASLNLLFTRYLHVPKRKLYRLFTKKIQ